MILSQQYVSRKHAVVKSQKPFLDRTGSIDNNYTGVESLPEGRIARVVKSDAPPYFLIVLLDLSFLNGEGSLDDHNLY